MNNKYTREFLKLVQENPELEIIPMVDSDVVAEDGYNWWFASFGSSAVNGCCKIRFNKDEPEQLVFCDDTEDYEEHLRDVLWDEDDELSDDEVDKRVEEVISKIEWTNVIVVSISTPEY